MSDTPRTDAIAIRSSALERWEWIESHEQLERELNASISENIRLHETIRQLRQELEELEHTRSLLNSIPST